jgi:hypothetical protein
LEDPIGVQLGSNLFPSIGSYARDEATLDDRERNAQRAALRRRTEQKRAPCGAAESFVLVAP